MPPQSAEITNVQGCVAYIYFFLSCDRLPWPVILACLHVISSRWIGAHAIRQPIVHFRHGYNS